MIKVNSLKVSPDKAKNLRQFFCKKYKVNESSISEFEIVKKSLDARKKDSICYIFSLLVTADSKTEKYLVGKFKEISFTEKVQGYILPKKAGDISEEEILDLDKKMLVSYSNGYGPYILPIDFPFITYEMFLDTLTNTCKEKIKEMNTLIKQAELCDFISELVKIWNMGVDAIIMQDIFLGK